MKKAEDPSDKSSSTDKYKTVRKKRNINRQCMTSSPIYHRILLGRTRAVVLLTTVGNDGNILKQNHQQQLEILMMQSPLLKKTNKKRLLLSRFRQLRKWKNNNKKKDTKTVPVRRSSSGSIKNMNSSNGNTCCSLTTTPPRQRTVRFHKEVRVTEIDKWACPTMWYHRDDYLRFRRDSMIVEPIVLTNDSSDIDIITADCTIVTTAIIPKSATMKGNDAQHRRRQLGYGNATRRKATAIAT